MRKSSFFVLILLFGACLSCASCLTEVKPILKPKTVSIDQRISDQEKWLDQDIRAKATTAVKTRPIRDSIEKIKKKYNAFQSSGTLTQEDRDAINRMLDKTSEQIFRLKSKTPGLRAR